MRGRVACKPLVAPAPPRRPAAGAALAPRLQPVPAAAAAATLRQPLHAPWGWQLGALALAAGLPAVGEAAAQLGRRAVALASLKAIEWVDVDPVDLFLLFAPDSFCRL